MIVILNKLDMIPENDRENIIKKKTDALRKVFINFMIEKINKNLIQDIW